MPKLIQIYQFLIKRDVCEQKNTNFLLIEKYFLFIQTEQGGTHIQTINLASAIFFQRKRIIFILF